MNGLNFEDTWKMDFFENILVLKSYDFFFFHIIIIIFFLSTKFIQTVIVLTKQSI